MAVRSLSPEVMVVDEIGGREDVQALKYVMNCGCSLIATVHGKHYEEILQKPELGELLRQGAFQRIIVLCYLSGPGHVQEICNGRGGRLL